MKNRTQSGKISFACDYMKGAHPNIIERLAETNMLETAGYGVAMGNGTDAAKAAARFVTDTNNQGGWAKAVKKYALEEE